MVFKNQAVEQERARTEEYYIEALKGHVDGPLTRDESYGRYSPLYVRYLKNAGMLDCYFDYRTMEEMVFITDLGRKILYLHDADEKLKDLRDILMSGGPRHGKEYEDAVRKAASVIPDRAWT